MNDKMISTTVDILGKPFPIKCPENELITLENTVAFLNKKIEEVKTSNKALNLEKVIIIAALNISQQFLQIQHQKSHLTEKINERIHHLQEKIDEVMNLSSTELV